jgi:uracil-DNA glycosylase family 4
VRYIVKDYLDCTRCGLHQFRRSIVFGRGKLPAKLLFVGEAPGKSEDLTGEPFIGPSGRLLNAAIDLGCKFAGITEAPSYFITNVVACRPTDEMNGDNRQPTQEEAWCCWKRLEKTFSDVNPQRVVLLGQVAKQALKKAFPDAIHLPHPAYLLRLGGIGCPAFTAFARDLSAIFKELS